jgi:hypothetical protein
MENLIQLDYTLVNSATNTPLVNVLTRLKEASSNNYVYGYTNNTGFVSGLVLKDVPLIMEVVSDCQAIIFSQLIGPFSGNTSLGTINVNLPQSIYMNFTGTVVNCSNAPVSNGYVSLYGAGGITGFANTDNAGNFSFSILNCTGNNLQYSYLGYDNITTQQTVIGTGNASSSAINLGTLSACGATSSTGVYIAGYVPGNISGLYVATLWKDGVPTYLADLNNFSFATGVYVDGNDVYVTGSESILTSSGLSLGRVWKNGSVLYTFTDNNFNTLTSSIVVSSGDVYVLGTVNDIPKIWKNGIPSDLQNSNPLSFAAATALYVQGSDVYVAGTTVDDPAIGGSRAVLWKNGAILTELNSNSQFSALFVAGTDIYVAGTEYINNIFEAKVWKNGVATTLETSTEEIQTNGLYVSGNDVYMAGMMMSPFTFTGVAKLWKNGIATNLSNSNNESNAVAVTVKNNDVYVLGSELTAGGNDKIKVWKNGFPINITDGTNNSGARGFFVR